MAGLIFLVPPGAEARALRGLHAVVTIVPAGRAAADVLPPFRAGALVVIAGLCGALDPAAAVGDVVIVRRIIGIDGRKRTADPEWCDRLAAVLPQARLGTAISTNAIVTGRTERRALHARGADVVDMEGLALAEALDARGVAWSMVRVVSDDDRYELPPIADAIDATGRLRPERLALGFARAPRAALRFARDAVSALAVLRRTARAIDAAFAPR